jgi:putative endonuclease
MSLCATFSTVKQTTQETGAFGEDKARIYLERRGYHIKESNWRFKRCEIDIIATFEDLLVFVEVKTRGFNDVVKPEAAVTLLQWGNIARAAGVYMARIDYDWEVRFDIVAVTLFHDGTHAIEHFQDIYFPGR